MSTTVHLGISTCPNDTFAFHAILNRRIDLDGLEFRIDLRDVQELNESLLGGKYDVAKASFHAALLCANETIVLPSGSALGFGVGPVLLSHQEQLSPAAFVENQRQAPKVLCPGQLTTATLLYRLFHDAGEIEQVVFSEIIPRLEQRSADFGVCIHEGRFSYQTHGLFLIEDLGRAWEAKTDCPLPLGGILARRSLGSELLDRIQHTIRRSIEYAHANRHETLATMKQYAQELSDEVLFAHVDLYVNRWTTNLGEIGQHSLSRLSSIAKESGLIASEKQQLEVLCLSR